MRSSARLALRLATLSSVTLASLFLIAAPAMAAQPGAPGAGGAPPTDPGAAPQLPAPDAPATPPASPPPSAETPQTPPPGVAPEAEPAPPTRAGRRRSMRSDPDADAPAEDIERANDPRRSHGVRLALDLGFERAVDGAPDRLNAGTPTLLPLGADVSFRVAPSMLFGFHGFAALASRDDCIKVDSCRARAYGLGAHIEHPFTRSASFVPYIRYGLGYELLYHGGAPLDPAGHLYRGAFDLLDLRIGGDFIVSRGEEKKTTRIGAFVGFTGGIVVNESGVSHSGSFAGGPVNTKNLDTASGSTHLWFVMGVRATLDP